MGDVIFALPTIRALGGGVLYLDPEGGETEPTVGWADKTRTSLNEKSIAWLSPLLRVQPYITDVRLWNKEPVDYNLDLWRVNACNNNIADSHLAAFKLPFSCRDTAWLTVSDPIPGEDGRNLVIARSVRVQSNYSFWVEALPKFKEKMTYIGLPKEHEIFEYTFDHKVHYRPVADALEMARVIAGCEQFIGNQGFPHSLAEGMKKNLVCEYYRVSPMTIFQRPGAQYV